MKGYIKFKYDEENDIVLASPFWKISSEEDCNQWFNQWTDYLGTFKRKMDCIMVLDNFVVDSAVSSYWGSIRAKLTNEYMRFSYRVNSNLMTGIYIKTSGITYSASAKEANTIESAVEAIKQERKLANI